MEKLFLGINSQIVCIRKKDGKELWRQKVKSGRLTNVYFDENKLFAYSGGHLFCLDAGNGRIRWERTLKGLGYGNCIIASESDNAALISAQMAAQQATAASTAVTSSAATNS
ncbi:MAG: PQQ-binding-like beta-propeller repeat protein [Enterobacterales bacterium]|nr:PQQ-binding-like beta-propeller repeat protein [Enterobacterales bacterium]